jgi:hypothetical protein
MSPGGRAALVLGLGEFAAAANDDAEAESARTA